MIRISAWAAMEKGGCLKKFTYERELTSKEILVDIKYCSLMRGDLRFIDNYWGDSIFPLVPGLEIIGIVKETGSDVKNIKIGDFVGVGYQVGSCFKCEYCLSGKEQFCPSQKLIPASDYGGLADFIIVDHRFAFIMPKNLRAPSSVPLLCAGLTCYSAIKKAGVRQKMNVGVVGIGNLGHLAVQFLNKMECSVTAFSHSKQKEKPLKMLGAEKFVQTDDEAELVRLERKYDFIISTSSASLNWELYLRALKPEGTLCFVGLPPDKISFKAELLADYAQRKIMGSYVGSRKDMADMLAFASKYNIHAFVEEFPMKGVNMAIEKMRKNEILFSAVIVNC